jgi:hypothetical protein
MKNQISLIIAISILAASWQGSVLAGQRSRTPRPPSRSQPAAQPAAGAETITGRITGDSGPIEDINVVALPAGTIGTTAALNYRNSKIDRAGNFTIENLTTGRYTLRISAPGYVTEAGDLEEDGRPRYFKPGDTVTVRMMKGGVITGTVTDQSGEPVTAIAVRATRIRDSEGRRARIVTSFRPEDLMRGFETDDRGVYRIWGLEPGLYVVSAGGSSIMSFLNSDPDRGVATYHPSSPREGATEIRVTAGQEVAGVDIRHRDIRGHTISGSVLTAEVPGGFLDTAVVTLTNAATRSLETMSIALPIDNSLKFLFDGIADGEYELIAMNRPGEARGAISLPRRVTVKGADISGVDVFLRPLGALSGRIVLEPVPASLKSCKAPALASGATLVMPRLNEDDMSPADSLAAVMQLATEALPNERGEFELGALVPGSYRLDVTPPSDFYYLRAITRLTAANRVSDEPGKRGINLRPGDKLAGFTISLAPGAASLAGAVSSQPERTPIPAGLRVHLVPVDKEHADDVLRYREAAIEAGLKFSISNVAPGRYWVVLRDQPARQEQTEPRPAAWDRKQREMLREAAQSSDRIVDLQPCQKITGFAIKHRATSTPPAGNRR